MIRNLEFNDIQGINQITPTDWSFDYENFLKSFLSESFFHAFEMIHNGEIVGTGNVLIKGKTGWLGNIIVDSAHRGKGFGYKITQYLVDFLEKKSCQTQLLIATELGEAVYTKIGFRKTSEYLCFDSTQEIKVEKSSSVRPLTLDDKPSVYSLDRFANRECRIHLLDKFYSNGLGYFKENELIGFYLPEFGRGLVIAQSEESGIELLKIKHSEKGKRTIVPKDNLSSIQYLENLNLKKGENASRMVLGLDSKWNPRNIYSYGSGYCG